MCQNFLKWFVVIPLIYYKIINFPFKNNLRYSTFIFTKDADYQFDLYVFFMYAYNFKQPIKNKIMPDLCEIERKKIDIEKSTVE